MEEKDSIFRRKVKSKSRSLSEGNAEPQPPSKYDPVLEKLVLLLSTQKSKEEGEEDEDDGKLASSIAVAIIILGLIIGGYFFIKPLFSKKPVDPAYAKVEAIKRIKDLTLVKHHYESIIPITKGKREKLQFLLVAPAQVSGYMDLSKIKFSIEEDSLITVQLPPTELSQTRISLKNTKEYTFQRSFWDHIKSQIDPRSNYLEAYDRIRIALDSARMDVRRRAIINGILEETEDKAEDYLRNLVNNLGYRVEFVKENQLLFSSDSLNLLYQQILQTSDPEERKQRENGLLRRLRRGINLFN